MRIRRSWSKEDVSRHFVSGIVVLVRARKLDGSGDRNVSSWCHWKVVCACKHYFYLRSPDQLLVMINEGFNERRLVPLATSLRKWHPLSENPFSEKHCKKMSGLVSALTGAYSADAHHCPRYLSSPSESWWQFDGFFFLVNWYKLWGLYEVYEVMVIPLNQLGGLKVLLVFALALAGYAGYGLSQVWLKAGPTVWDSSI